MFSNILSCSYSQHIYSIFNVQILVNLAAPEEPPPDNRSLYDRLQEQKMRKQEEYEEAHKLSMNEPLNTII